MSSLVPLIHRLFARIPVNHSIDVLYGGRPNLAISSLPADNDMPASFNNVTLCGLTLDVISVWQP